jgi:DNA-binding NtrC family response regulator
MKDNLVTHLFIVDDDAVYLKFLEIEFKANTQIHVSTFATGEACIEHLNNKPDFIILDYHLNGINKSAMNGIEILDKIKEINPDIPIIMLSAQDKIEVAVDCLHHAAYDYVVKSETAFFRIQEIISKFTRLKNLQNTLNWYIDRM